MSGLNTVEKGDSFEKKVYELFNELLTNDELFISGKRSKIFWKKPYYSESRKGQIIVDISIETYLKDANNYSLLTILECKNYSKGVSVDNIEEFDSKLNQIGAHNTKGIIITSSYFQEGTINFAISKKIGLLRINDNNERDWINYRKDKKHKQYDIDSIKSYFYSNDIHDKNFIAYFDRKIFESIPHLFFELGIIDKFSNRSKHINIPYLTEEQIQLIIDQLPNDNLYNKDKLNTDNVCKIINKRYNVNFNFDKELDIDKGILGKLSFNPLEICISKSLKTNIYRWRFTLAHEIGHLMLHHQQLSNYIDEHLDSESSTSINQDIMFYNNKRLEIQANIFACRLLLPQETLLRLVFYYFKRERINKGFLYLDNQPCNFQLVFPLLQEIQNHFDVSIDVAKYRLISLNLLHDKTDKSIHSIFKNI